MSLDLPDQGPITDAGPLGGGGSDGDYPFRLSFQTVGGELRLFVANGKNNLVSPTLGGVALDADPAPYMVATALGSALIFIKTVSDYGTLDTTTGVWSYTQTITIEHFPVGSPPADVISTTSWTKFDLIGQVTVTTPGGVATGAVDYQYITTNRACQNFGGNNLAGVA